MSSFIPMVSSSPPPMDEGGGFDWEDDDDDDFGTFASADTSMSFKIDEYPKPSDFNQSMNMVNDKGNEEFADFAAFDSNNDQFKDSTSNEICEDMPDSVPCSNDSVRTSSVNSEERGFSVAQDCKSGPLSDSGMFSSEMSPVPLNEEVGTAIKKCEHTDSLDDIQTDSSTDNTECVVNAELESTGDIDNEKNNLTECSADFIHISHDRVESGEPVILQESENLSLRDSKESSNNDPPANTAYLENTDDSTVCSDHKTQTSINSEYIPKSRTDHSSSEPYANDIEDSSGSTPQNETCNISRDSHLIDSHNTSLTDNIGTDHNQDHIKSSLGSELDKEISTGVLHDSNEQGNRVNSNDLSAEDLDIPEINTLNNGNNPENAICDKDSVYLADVEHFINDKILPEALKRFSGSDTEKNIRASDLSSPSDLETDHSINRLTYQDNNDGDTSNAHQDDTEPNKEGKAPMMDDSNAEDCEDFGEFKDSIKDKDKETFEKIKAGGTFEESEFGDFSSVSQTSFSHGEASTSLGNTSQEVIANETQETNSASDDDDFCDFSSGSVEVTKTHDTESGVESSEKIVSSNSESVDNNDCNGTSQSRTDLNLSDLGKPSESQSVEEEDEFGDFSDFTAGRSTLDSAVDSGLKNDSFASFPSESSGEANNDWAAFDEPQATTEDDGPAEDEDWGDFGDETNISETQPVKVSETQHLPAVALQNMTKHEKLMFAVTSCFPDVETLESKMNMPVNDLKGTDGQKSTSDPNLWVQIRNLQSSKEVSYQWSKSEWNSQLFTTLHIDTRNVLFGHRKASVPIYAAGLTLLEPVKGSSDGVLKPDVLVDTMKTDNGSQQSQMHKAKRKQNKNETIPPAQFDWTGSGLTNPLEANNKTLNLDFLIQDQSTKSSELESEFLGPEPVPIMKPAIQPLENILANLKSSSSSTFKPANQTEDISPEAQKVVQSLPNLSFMKSSVLMFPIHME